MHDRYGAAVTAMSRASTNPVDVQRAYYARTAESYEAMHGIGDAELDFPLAWLAGHLQYSGARSLLDLGSGTGRALRYIKNAVPGIAVVGIEPSAELRAVGIQTHGLTADELRDGDALALPFADSSFDVVCEFSALHHIPNPRRAVEEMLRVARSAIFVSDCNNFGQGSRMARRLKQVINACGLWSAVDLLRTRGRGYHYSEGDGVYYSYSVFNDLPAIQAACRRVHILNTAGASVNHYADAPHVTVLGIK